ncbi:MAG: hypothetical protein ACXIU8_01165 [Alkalilacustris sp.]
MPRLTLFAMPVVLAMAFCVGSGSAHADTLGQVTAQLGDEAFSASVRTAHPALPEGVSLEVISLGGASEITVDALALPDSGGVAGRGAVILGLSFEFTLDMPVTPDMLADFFVLIAETWPEGTEEPEFVWVTAPEDGTILEIDTLDLSDEHLVMAARIEEAQFCLVHVDDLFEFDDSRGDGECRQGALQITLDTR